jgi:putative polyketide hydroxylase
VEVDVSAEDVDVLVVGGGLVGLAAGAFLAQHGVRVLVAERHPSTSRHPKARLVNARSMELYRALGVEAGIRAAGEPSGGFAVAETLAAEHESWIAPPEEGVDDDLGPAAPCACDQQRIEPILRDRALALGACVRFATTVGALEERDGAVTAELDGPAGRSAITARFVVAADGVRGGTRERLGIGRHGESVPGTAVSALFRADLEPALRGRRGDAVMARSAGAFLFARGDGTDRTWQLGTYLRPEWGTPDAVDRGVREVIRAATGLPELQPEVEDVVTWTTGGFVADRFRRSRVFLVGDAAHELPPYGGFGGNTGVQDAHNLAWKLAAVCRGAAGDALLDTYAAERGPIAEMIVNQALLRSRKVPGRPAPPGQIDAAALILGFRYPAPGVTGYDPTRPVEDPARLSGSPGTRAPHVGLAPGRSVADLLDPCAFTFVCAEGGAPQAPVPGVRVRTVDPRDVRAGHRPRWEACYAGPAVDGMLVRPDGVLCWRAGPGQATGPAIAAALRRALSAPGY